jgi:hypothetical protein
VVTSSKSTFEPYLMETSVIVITAALLQSG